MNELTLPAGDPCSEVPGSGIRDQPRDCDTVAISEYVYRRRVQYKETDASGMAHFTAFFTYAEEAEHALWREAGLSIEPKDSDIGWPRVSASFEFKRPLQFEDEVEVRLRVIGKTAKALTYQAVIVVNGTIAAVGRHTSICVKRHPGEPIKAADMPPAIFDTFEAIEPLELG